MMSWLDTEQYPSEASNNCRLPIFAIGLSCNVQQGTIPPVAAKSATEIGVSQRFLEPTHAQAWFFVGTRPSYLEVLLAYLGNGIYSVMAVRARASQEALDSKVSSYANLSRAATRRLASLCGGKNLLTLEAAIMATTPTSIASKSFTFLVAQGQSRLASLHKIRIVSALGRTEAEARAQFANLPLVFMGCTPAKGVDTSSQGKIEAIINSLFHRLEIIDLTDTDRDDLYRTISKMRELLGGRQ